MSKGKGKLSTTQARMLDFLRSFIGQFQYPPTIRDIQDGCGISSTSVVDYNLKRLEKKGYIMREKGVARGLSLVESVAVAAGLRSIPVLGRIQAGQPLPLPPTDFSFFDPESVVELAATMLPTKAGDLFALEVRGDSMIDALVNDGDLVVLRPAQEARNGMMVAALVDGETTLKHYYHEKGRVRLQPANPAYPPIIVREQDVMVQGQVVMVLRRMDM